MRSRDILNTLYLHLHQTNGYQIWEGGESPWRVSTHKIHLDLRTCVNKRSRDKRKTYLHRHNAYGPKIYHCGDIMQGAPAHKFAWPWSGHVWPSHKLNTLFLHLQKFHEHETRQGDDLQWESLIVKATWPYDHVTNRRSHYSLKTLYFGYQKTYGK